MQTRLARTVQQLTAEIALLDLQAQLCAVEPVLALVAENPDSAGRVEELLVQFRVLTADAEGLGQLRVAAVGHLAERLLETYAFEVHGDRCGLVALVLRAHELIRLLLEDARRQLEGRPAASLDGAIEALTDQIANLGWRYGWMRDPVIH